MSLVRAVIGDSAVSVGAAYAQAKGLTVLEDEPAFLDDGRPRPESPVAKKATPLKAESSAAPTSPSKEK